MSASTVESTRALQPVFLAAEWRWLAIANYAVPAEVLEPLVPRGTELDLFAGQALVSFVGFRFLRTRVLGLSLPGLRDFDEFNLRFYVRRTTAAGEVRRGVVFVKEIVPRRLVAWVARIVYEEPYVARPMRHRLVTVGQPAATYEFRDFQRWQRLTITSRATEPALPAAGSLDEFVIEHYWGYTRRSDGGTSEYQVQHPSWRVWPVDRVELDCDVAAVYGAKFAEACQGAPVSAVLAEGSPITVHRGTRV